MTVSGPGAGAPRVAAVAGGGGALLTWLRDGRVQARMQAAGGRLGPVLAVSARGERASGPRVSFAADGAAVLAWTAVDGHRSGGRRLARLVARTLSAGRLTAPVVVASLEAGHSWEFGTAADGTAVFVWDRGRGSDRRVYARTLTASGPTAAVAVSAAGSRAVLPRVAVAADGRALVAWTFSVPGAPDNELDRVQARWLSKTARTAGSIIDVSTRTPNPGPRIAIDRLTGGFVVWIQTRTSDGERRVLTRSLSRDGGRGRTVEIAAGPSNGSAKVATSADGSATFGWLASDADFSNRRIQTRTRSAAGALSPVATLASSVESDVWPDADVYPQLAVAATGAAVVTWTRTAGAVATAQAAVRP